MQNRLVRLCLKNSSVKVAGPVRLTNLFGPVCFTAEISGLEFSRPVQVIPVSEKTQVRNKFGNCNKKGVFAMSKIYVVFKDVLLFPLLLSIGFLAAVILMNSPLVRALWMEGV